jgi:hypothetical protein
MRCWCHPSTLTKRKQELKQVRLCHSVTCTFSSILQINSTVATTLLSFVSFLHAWFLTIHGFSDTWRFIQRRLAIEARKDGVADALGGVFGAVLAVV